MSQFTVYKSTDGSAPTVSGTAGDLVNLLDKCLVAGYGSKSAAGWTKPYTGTNKAAFKNGGGCQMYVRVQDDAPGAGGAREARVRGFETMSDVDTGTGAFPTTAQLANGLFVRKSTTADATTRAWIVVADSATAYVFIATGDTANVYQVWMFGEFYSFVNSDGYRNMLIANSSENSATTCQFGSVGNALAANSGHYVPRGYTGVGNSVQVGKHGDGVKTAGNSNLDGIIPYPNPCDGGFLLSPVWIHDPTTSPAVNIRGLLRGIWHGLHPVASVTHADTFDGTGDAAGKSFLIIKSIQQPSSACYCVVETSNTLLTN